MMQGWYPVALSSAIEAGTSAGAVLDGQEIVVWRDTSGAAHVWEDRCPHRGMKMSFGFVRGDHIACLYHGWEYDPAGQCRKIPAHPDLEVPKTICMKTYGCAEAGGMIWACLAGEAAAPELPAALAVRSLYVDAPVAAVTGALAAGMGAAGLAGDLPLLRLDTDLGPLVVGVQPVDAGRTALHITVAGDATPQTRSTLAARAEALRHQVEQAGTGSEAAA